MLVKAGTRGADGVVLNLEDAVAPARKEQAREAVASVLVTSDFGSTERIVRINPVDSDAGFTDLFVIAPLAPDAILLPKVTSAEQVRYAAWAIERLESIHGLSLGKIRIMCMIETAAGVLRASEIARAHPRVTALLFGAADFSADVNCEVADDQPALLHAANHIVLAARSAQVSAIDAPYMRLRDSEGLELSVRMSRQLGFDGKSAIHPAQIPAIHAAFTPSREQIRWANSVTAALTAAVGSESAEGAAVLDGQLIEAPHLHRARNILGIAGKMGIEEEPSSGD
jgi:citrate lyase subunit beta / citryl-CoA lyase